MIKKVRLQELAELVQGEVIGDGEILISDVSGLDTAGEGDISFLAKSAKKALLDTTDASAVIVPLDIEEAPQPAIRVKSPYLASAIIHNYLLEEEFIARGIHEKAHVGSDCTMGEKITIEAFAVIGDSVTLGERVRIRAGVVIGDNVTIGDDCDIHPNVVIEEGSVLGNRIILHAGTVIGSDGYGYAPDEQGCHIKRPQVGIVQIDDDVEIGANCCVDRAAFGVTWIKAGTKIDNLVQVAHNVVLGENCLLVGQSAVAGSTILGRNVVLGGKAAVVGHITVNDGVMVAGQSGVTKNFPPGSVVGGTPAIQMTQYARAAAGFSKIPDLRNEVRALKKELEEVKKQLANDNRNTGGNDV